MSATREQILDLLNQLEAEGAEREALLIVRDRLAELSLGGQTAFTDFSPASPHMQLLSAIAALSGMAVYYTANVPYLIEKHLTQNLMAAAQLEAQPSTSTMVFELYAPAAAGGYTIEQGITLPAGPVLFELLAPLVIPEGKTGVEQSGGEYLYYAPVRAVSPGSYSNVLAGTAVGLPPILVGVKRAFLGRDAIGGQDRETYDAMVERVFKRQLDDGETKLVLIADFINYITRRLGVGTKVHVVTPPPTPGYITISAILPGGAPLDENDGIVAELNAKSPLAPVLVAEPLIETINVTLTATYLPQLTSYDTVRSAIQRAIEELLSPLRWPFWGTQHNSVAPSLIVATVQNITGVKRVSLATPAAEVDLGQPHAVPQLGTLNLTVAAEV